MEVSVPVSFIVVALNSRDRYEFIGLRKISHSIKQLCKSDCLKVLEMHQQCSTSPKQNGNRIFRSTASF